MTLASDEALAVIYLDDRLPMHPKVCKAAEIIGRGGHAAAFTLFVMAVGYARENLTDGFLPVAWVHSNGFVLTPERVAAALVKVGLWRKVRGGYTIHDYFDWNKTATEVKANREYERVRKAAQRRRGNGRYSEAS